MTLKARIWKLAHGRSLELGPKALIMGILNVTPDSFSDGGRFDTFESAKTQSVKMIEEGAAIIDVGGESTRPGSEPVTADQEQDRIMPVIEWLAANTGAVISVDTYRSDTARMAIAAGAHIVNDVWGLHKDPAIAMVAKETGAGLVAMHTGRERDKREDVIEDQKVFFQKTFEIAAAAGIRDDQLVIDPGFGFAKDPEENLQLMARFDELRIWGYPILVGTSRKRFIGHVTGRDGDGRDVGTAATSLYLRLHGADIFRVHNVAYSADTLAFADAMLDRTPEDSLP